MQALRKDIVTPERTHFKFGAYSCVLGDRNSAKHIYDCRIMDYEGRKQDRVRVCASDFGEVKWAMMGYTKRHLLLSPSTVKGTKNLVMPDDVGARRFLIIVVREK